MKILQWINWVLYTAVLPPILLPMGSQWLISKLGWVPALCISALVLTLYFLAVLVFYLKMLQRRRDKEL